MPSNELHVSPEVLKKSCFGHSRPRYRKFYDFVRLLFASSLFGPRDYLLNTNAGRGGGVEACVLADLASGRLVRAVEDDPKMVRAVASYTRRRTNLRLRRGSLGDADRDVPEHETAHGNKSRSYTLNKLAGADGKWSEPGTKIALVLVSVPSPLAHASRSRSRATSLPGLAQTFAFVRGGADVIRAHKPIFAMHSTASDASELALYLTERVHVEYVVRAIVERNASHVTNIVVPRDLSLPSGVDDLLRTASVKNQ